MAGYLTRRLAFIFFILLIFQSHVESITKYVRINKPLSNQLSSSVFQNQLGPSQISSYSYLPSQSNDLSIFLNKFADLGLLQNKLNDMPLQSAFQSSFPYLPSSFTNFPSINVPSLSLETPVSYIHVPSLPSISPPVIPIATTTLDSPSTSSLDATLLNNMAIALQLLILSNLMSMPLPESQTSESTPVDNPEQCEPPQSSIFPPLAIPESMFLSPAFQVPMAPPTEPYQQFAPIQQPPIQYLQPMPPKQPYEYPPNPQYPVPNSVLAPQYYPQQYEVQHQPRYEAPKQPTPYQPPYVPPSVMPNSNFLGSSFAETNSFGALPLGSYSPSLPPPSPNSRTSLALMSPYEAIGPNSPYTDPILSSRYGSIITSKKDFQSPYMSIMAEDNNRDLFAI